MNKISFVIPTYNFAAFIGQTLDSILSDSDIDYEILVYDGCSTDNTRDIVNSYCLKDARIRYLVSEGRTNIDIDMNDAVTYATGDFIWTLSADDVLVQGWGSQIGNLLESYQADLYLLPAIHCTLDMRPYHRYEILRKPTNDDRVWSVGDERDFESYLSEMRTSEGLFSFCSACIVKREKLQKTDLLEDINGTCWRYAARLISVALTYPLTIVVANKALVLKRGDNDSFAVRGVVHRIGVAICQWSRAIEHLKASKQMKARMIQLAHSDISFLSLLYASQFSATACEESIYKDCILQRYNGEDAATYLKRTLLLWFGRTRVFAPLLRWGKKFFQKNRRWVQKMKMNRA